MRDRSSILVLGALIALFVALSTFDVSFLPLSLTARQLLPVLIIAVIILFLMRVRCCDGGAEEEVEPEDQDGEDTVGRNKDVG